MHAVGCGCILMIFKVVITQIRCIAHLVSECRLQPTSQEIYLTHLQSFSHLISNGMIHFYCTHTELTIGNQNCTNLPLMAGDTEAGLMMIHGAS